MPETMDWSINLQVSGGPKVARAGRMTVEAYDKLNVTLDAGATDVDVDLQPASTPGQVTLIALTASVYDPALTYSADGGTTALGLEAPVTLIGAGAVSLLSSTPKQLRFANGTADPCTVEILVGRDATP